MGVNSILYLASLLTALTIIVTTFFKVCKAMKAVYDKIHEFQEIMEENTMYTLKLVILNENLSLEERIHAGDRYIELHGNGYVHSIYDQLKRRLNNNMSMIQELINQIAGNIIQTFLAVIVAYIGIVGKRLYQKYVNTELKKL